MRQPDLPSNSAIQKSGKYLRDIRRGTIDPTDVDPERRERAIQVVTAFREAHGYPMGKIRMGLQSMVNTEQLDAAVSQRHKRVPRIIRKLARRAEGTNLANLEDIGGCRVVVATPADMEVLCRRIRRNWSRDFMRDPDQRDYVANPKMMGYRAKHFVVRRDGRAVEVQVRTRGQQRWAEAVESLDNRHRDLNLKDEEGPDELIENFQIAGEIIHCQEWGHEITDEQRLRLIESNNHVIRLGWYSR